MAERRSFADLEYSVTHWETGKPCQLCLVFEYGTAFSLWTLAQSSLDSTISPAEGKNREYLPAG